VSGPPALAAPQPLWEFGLGAGLLVFDDYRGADRAHGYVLPVPYFIYRGTFVRADRSGVRGRLYERPRVEINASLNATVPVRSSAHSARAGMPDLPATIEIGPSLQWHLWRSADARVRLDLRVPVRTAVTVASHPHLIGTYVAPAVNLDFLPPLAGRGWNIGLLAGPLLADRRYHGYFYDVAPAYATAQRSAYQAAGGYSGTEVLLAVSRRYQGFWIGAFVRHDWLGGATFVHSPLVRQEGYWAGGLGMAWMIGQSSRQVDADE
jgi:outer membrane protein